MLLTKSRIFNISFDSSSLNIFLFSYLHLLQTIEGGHVFSMRYDIFGFFLYLQIFLLLANFLYLLQITQYNFFIFLINKNILILFYHSFYNY